MEPTARGHAVRPHTADVVIEAWGPTAAACYEEAAGAFVGVFADIGDSPSGVTERFDVGPGRPEDLLVLLLEEVRVAAEARGRTSRRSPVRRCAAITSSARSPRLWEGLRTKPRASRR
jgi:SHS2 domain-containing protein